MRYVERYKKLVSVSKTLINYVCIKQALFVHVWNPSDLSVKLNCVYKKEIYNKTVEVRALSFRKKNF